MTTIATRRRNAHVSGYDVYHRVSKLQEALFRRIDDETAQNEWWKRRRGVVGGIVGRSMGFRLPAINDVVRFGGRGTAAQKRYIVTGVNGSVYVARALSGGDKGSLVVDDAVGGMGPIYVDAPAAWTSADAQQRYDDYKADMEKRGHGGLVLAFTSAELRPAVTFRVPVSEADPDVTVSHTVADGTIAHFDRNKEIAGIVRRYGFIWVPSVGVWRRLHSVGTPRPSDSINLASLKHALNTGGFRVAFEIDVAAAPDLGAQAESKLARAEAKEAHAAKLRGFAKQQWGRFEQIHSAIPFGQPILVGHHSEKRHRRDIATASKAADKSHEAQQYAAKLEGDAERLRREAARLESLPEVSRSHESLIAFTTKLSKLMQGLKRDLHATRITQNYVGTGTQAHRRQVFVRWPSGVIDVWLEADRAAIGGVVGKRGASVPYADSPEATYAAIIEALRPFAPTARVALPLHEEVAKLIHGGAKRDLGATLLRTDDYGRWIGWGSVTTSWNRKRTENELNYSVDGPVNRYSGNEQKPGVAAWWGGRQRGGTYYKADVYVDLTSVESAEAAYAEWLRQMRALLAEKLAVSTAKTNRARR